MQMSEQEPREVPVGNAQLIQSNEYTAADIKHELFDARLHQNAWAESLDGRRGRTGSQQHHAEHWLLGLRRLK